MTSGPPSPHPALPALAGVGLVLALAAGLLLGLGVQLAAAALVLAVAAILLALFLILVLRPATPGPLADPGDLRGTLAMVVLALDELAAGRAGQVGADAAAGLRRTRDHLVGQLRMLADRQEIAQAARGHLRPRVEVVAVDRLLDLVEGAFRSAPGVRVVRDRSEAAVAVDLQRVAALLVRLASVRVEPVEVHLGVEAAGGRVGVEVACRGQAVVPDPVASRLLEQVARAVLALQGATLATGEAGRVKVLLARRPRGAGAARPDRRRGDRPAAPARRATDRDLLPWVTALEHQEQFRCFELWHPPRPGVASLRLLLVDADEKLLDYAMSDLGGSFLVEVATGLHEALARAAARPPHVVACAYALPDGDGLDLARRLKGEPGTREVRILVFGAREGLADLAGAEAVDAWLAKPFTPGELAAALRALGERHAGSGAALAGPHLELVSGGLAHELFNPLTVINGGLAVLARALPALSGAGGPASAGPGEEAAMARVQSVLPAMRRASERIGQLVEQMQAWSRTGYPSAPALVLVDAVVEQVATRLAAPALQVDLKAAGACCLVVEEELDQVVGNLVRNALRAAGPEGRVELRSRLDGPWVAVEVADDGPGVPLEIRDRIFHPFFTTQKAGEGLGMGLALTRQLVERASGTVELVDTPGRGALFRVRLRRA